MEEELDVMKCPYMVCDIKVVLKRDSNGNPVLREGAVPKVKKVKVLDENGYVKYDEHHDPVTKDVEYYVLNDYDLKVELDKSTCLCSHGNSDQRKKKLAEKCTAFGKCPEGIYTKENYNHECIEYNKSVIAAYKELVGLGCNNRKPTFKLKVPTRADGAVLTQTIGEYWDIMYPVFKNDEITEKMVKDKDFCVFTIGTKCYPSSSGLRMDSHYNGDCYVVDSEDRNLTYHLGDYILRGYPDSALSVVVSKKHPCRYEINCLNVLDSYSSFNRNKPPFIPNVYPRPDFKECLDGICFFKDKEHVCPACGNTFVEGGFLNGREEHVFCSFDCSRKGAKQVYEPTTNKRLELTQETYQEILERDKYKCRLCGSTDNLQVHHLVPLYVPTDKKLYDVNGQYNLITVCSKCHNQIHPHNSHIVANDDLENKGGN